MRALGAGWWAIVSYLAIAGCLTAAVHGGQPAAAEDDELTVVLASADGVTGEAIADKPAQCEEGQCPEGACPDSCDEATTIDAKVAVATELAAEEQPSSDQVRVDSAKAAGADSDVVRPTHKQTLIINVNNDSLPPTTLHSFCLAGDGKILAACGAGAGEVRVFDADGAYVESWDLPVKPDAINVGSDGNIYIAGGGKLLRLDAQGHILHQADSPHAAELMASKDQLRQEIIDQQKQMAGQFDGQIERYDKLIADLEKKIAAAKDAGKEPSKADERRLEAYAQMKKQFEEMAEQYGGKELTEEELEQQVKASLEYKLQVASISETGGDVFMATRSAAGYGFSVWKLDRNFTGGQEIVSDLRGCCGQMDVQCCDAGVFVAENARHRVACYDKNGKMIASWGQQARTGLDGFGSCCNPMNVAFGPDGTIYTAESELGRVKRFKPNGELVELVGKVDIVPGCKKVAIAVEKSGDNVFMLDISRNHIVKMERLADGEQIAYYERRSGAEGEAGGGRSIGGALLRIFTGD